MSDNIVFPCPACGTKYSVGPHHAGKKTSCKKCGAALTVPQPNVQNPTIVGGTRTIRRADMAPSVSERQAPTQSAAAPPAPAAAPATEVDMQGGASVLRKEETVYGVTREDLAQGRGRARAGTRAPARRGAGNAPRGRAMAPQGATAKKSVLPLMLGIGGGVLAVIIVIIVVVVSSGPGKTGGTGGDGGDSKASVPKKSEEELLLESMRRDLNNAMNLGLEDCLRYYTYCKEQRAVAGFKDMQAEWATHVREKALGASTKSMAEIALMLEDDGFGARQLLKKARENLKPGKYVLVHDRETDRDRQKWIENKTYTRVITLLGWTKYKMPDKFDDYGRWAFPEFRVYNRALVTVQGASDSDWIPPDKIEHLKELEAAVWIVGRELEERHAKDHFAINAREAYVRFLEAHKGGKVDRKKGKRSFSPEAMNRPWLSSEDDPAKTPKWEPIEDVWTYTYWKPFIVYVEKRPAQDDLDQELIDSLETKAALLRQLETWFRTKLVNKFNLQRVKPLGSGGTGKDGKTYDTLGKLAEADGWPLQIIVLKDGQTYQAFLEDTIGRGIPGARAHYSPPDAQIITWDDHESFDPDTLWFNESVLIHESFHMLSDHYAANPIGKNDDLRPRYANILVQEGLTDSVAGFSKEGEGGEATYKFLQVNHLRLRNWQQTYKSLEDKNIYRIRDMIRATTYSQCNQIGYERWQELGLNRARGFVIASQNGFLGLYYASACTASYFFQNYRKRGSYPYRNKWWEYIGKDYKGELGIPTINPQAGVRAFKEVFGIESDADWDTLEKLYVEFTSDLDPENVGKGLEGDELKKEESRLPTGIGPGGRSLPALPRREDD